MFNFSCWYPLILVGIMYKYKDETPNKTVDRIKQILNKFVTIQLNPEKVA